MEKEIVFRVCRIIFVILFLVVVVFLRKNVLESYSDARETVNSLSNSLKVIDVSQSNNKYTLTVINYGFETKKFTILLASDEESTISNDKVNYTVVRNGEQVMTSKLNDDGQIAKDVLEVNQTSTYEIKFWLDDDFGDYGKFSSRLVLI